VEFFDAFFNVSSTAKVFVLDEETENRVNLTLQMGSFGSGMFIPKKAA
jgi:hypothetical protein